MEFFMMFRILIFIHSFIYEFIDFFFFFHLVITFKDSVYIYFPVSFFGLNKSFHSILFSLLLFNSISLFEETTPE